MPVCIYPNDGTPLLETNQEGLRKKYGIEQFEYPTPTSQIKHIGFNPKTQTWYGWSHRAIFGFKVGDRVKAGDIIAKGTAADLRPDAPAAFPLGFEARTLDDAKRMAAKFAIEVS